MALPQPGKDRAAVITGASSGIGEEFAQILARRGYQVVLVARSVDRLEELAARLGEQAHPLPADLSDRDRATLLERVTALGLVPDILVNDAGLSTMGLVAKSVPEKELNLVEVDVAAVVDLCSRFLPGMVDRKRGAVLNVASMAGFGPLPGPSGLRRCQGVRVVLHPQPARRATRHRGQRDRVVSGPGGHRIRRRGRVHQGGSRKRPSADHVGSRRPGGPGRNRRVGGRQGHGSPGGSNQVAGAIVRTAHPSCCCRSTDAVTRHSNATASNVSPMLFAALRDMQWRRRRLVIAIISTGLVFAMTLVMIGLANGFRVEAQRAVDSMDVDTFVIKAGAAGPLLGATPFAEAELARGGRYARCDGGGSTGLCRDDGGRGNDAAQRHRVRGAGARTGHAARVRGPPSVDARTRSRYRARWAARSATIWRSGRARCGSSASCPIPPHWRRRPTSS